VVDAFLASLKADGYPEFKSVFSAVEKTEPKPETKDGKTDAKDGKPEVKVEVKPAPKPATKGGGTEFTSNPQYRTVDVTLKRNLNAVDSDELNPPMIVYAELLAPNEYDPKLFKKHLKPIGDVLDPVLKRARSIGMNLTTFTQVKFSATVRIVTGSTARPARWRTST